MNNDRSALRRPCGSACQTRCSRIFSAGHDHTRHRRPRFDVLAGRVPGRRGTRGARDRPAGGALAAIMVRRAVHAIRGERNVRGRHRKCIARRRRHQPSARLRAAPPEPGVFRRVARGVPLALRPGLHRRVAGDFCVRATPHRLRPGSRCLRVADFLGGGVLCTRRPCVRPALCFGADRALGVAARDRSSPAPATAHTAVRPLPGTVFTLLRGIELQYPSRPAKHGAAGSDGAWTGGSSQQARAPVC